MSVKNKDVISPEIMDIIESLIKGGDLKPPSNTPVYDYLTTLVEESLNAFKASTTLKQLVGKNSIPTVEFEVRFASKNKRSLTKTQFDNVVKYLKSFSFTQKTNTFENKMRILVGSNSNDTGLRVELEGLVPIQQYCRTENLETLLQINKETVKFTKKADFMDVSGKTYSSYYNGDYDMKYSFTTEDVLELNDKIVRNVRQNWKRESKLYRILNRLTFKDGSVDASLFNIDMSVVKQSQPRRGGLTMLNSGVVDAYPIYEIECELDNTVLFEQLFKLCVESFDETTTRDEMETILKTYIATLYSTLKKYVKIVNMGLQDSKYIIQQGEKENIQEAYTQLVFGRLERRLMPKHFCGPSSYTLQPENILPLEDTTTREQGMEFNNESLEEGEVEMSLLENPLEMNKIAETPNIRGHYCVTDKADGIRKLLFINNVGRIYLINTSMEIQYTGCNVKTNKNLTNSIIDGEHVTHNKNGKFINSFFAFDIYFLNGKNVRSIPFTTMGTGGSINDTQRLKLLNTFIRDINDEWSKHYTTKIPLDIKSKKFFIAQKDFSIFECCFKILDSVLNGDFEYETDGLIFTPTLLPVGSSSMKLDGPIMKSTWSHSFKWKPPKYNTVDFLVTTQKNKNGNDIIENMYYGGTTGPQGSEIKQFKKIVLRCGYDAKKHGIINACFKVYNGDKLKQGNGGNMDMNDDYIPAPFFPTNPYDETTHDCRIELKSDSLGNKVMVTTEGEVFEDEMIVEFSYDMDGIPGEKWNPLRVRYDKTQEYRNGYKNFGNAYHVANSNWQSIHNPIGEYSITTGEKLPSPINDDVYYSSQKKSDLTRSMRKFHNIVVKQTLLRIGSMLSIPTLLDLAVGKAGDLNKWIEADYHSVIGVDISKDNINNPQDGACVRYLRKQQRKHYNETIPESLFFQANSSLNLKNGDGFYSDIERSYMKILYGDKSSTEDTPQRVKRMAGSFKEGFGVTACMFALHYFFRNSESLKTFLTNVAENTTKDGLFIGCCFDGEKLFNLLRNKKKGESFTIQQDGELITRITKKYDQTSFDENSLSLGMPISVYQESIGTESTEYLVNFGYLKKVMSLFGFEVLNNEAMSSTLPPGSGTVPSIGNFMNLMYLNERMNIQMSDYEKELSYLNNYFVFVKKTNVDIGTIGILDDVGMIDSMLQQSAVKTEEVLSVQAARRAESITIKQQKEDDKPKKIKMKIKRKDN